MGLRLLSIVSNKGNKMTRENIDVLFEIYHPNLEAFQAVCETEVLLSGVISNVGSGIFKKLGVLELNKKTKLFVSFNDSGDLLKKNWNDFVEEFTTYDKKVHLSKKSPDFSKMTTLVDLSDFKRPFIHDEVFNQEKFNEVFIPENGSWLLVKDHIKEYDEYFVIMSKAYNNACNKAKKKLRFITVNIADSTLVLFSKQKKTDKDVWKDAKEKILKDGIFSEINDINDYLEEIENDKFNFVVYF
jgi:hypothetical protein